MSSTDIVITVFIVSFAIVIIWGLWLEYQLQLKTKPSELPEEPRND